MIAVAAIRFMATVRGIDSREEVPSPGARAVKLAADERKQAIVAPLAALRWLQPAEETQWQTKVSNWNCAG